MFNRTNTATPTTNPGTLAWLAEITAPVTTPRQYGGERLSNVRAMISTLKGQSVVSLPGDLFARTEQLTARVDAVWTAHNQAQDDDRARADATVDALYCGAITTDEALTFGESLWRGRDGHEFAFNVVRRACDRLRDDAVAAGVHAGREAHAVICTAMHEVLAGSNAVDEFHPSAGELLDRYLSLYELAAATTCRVTSLKVPGMSPTLARCHADRTARDEAVKAATEVAEARRSFARMTGGSGFNIGR